MKDEKKLKKKDIEKLFADSSNKAAHKWKPANFERQVRAKPVSAYAITFTGGT